MKLPILIKKIRRNNPLMNLFKITLLIMTLLFGCQKSKNLLSVENPIFEHAPEVLVYDTISGVFLYEYFIKSYIEADVLIKDGGFIKSEVINEKSYNDGYYIGKASVYVDQLKQKGLEVRYDISSLATFYDSLYKDYDYKSNTINPFCGSYYKKYNLTLEVLFIDTISHRVPLLLNCDEFEQIVKQNNYRNYGTKSLPTFIITKIINWREL